MRPSLLVLPLASAFAAPTCDGNPPSAHFGSTPTSKWHDRQFRVVFAQNKHVYLSQPADGARFTTRVAVNSVPETIDSNGENRPKIAFTDEAVLALFWRHIYGDNIRDHALARISAEGGAIRTAGDCGQLAYRSLHTSRAGYGRDRRRRPAPGVVH